MIYLRPIGGLCNRMRTIDSFLSLCTEYKQNLTVIWTMDETLNCSFYELFEFPEIESFELSIIDCPRGFPETNLVKLGKRADNSYKINCTEESGYLKGMAKSVVLRTELNSVQRKIAKRIDKIVYDNVLTNSELKDIFDSSESTSLTTREMDEAFLPKAEMMCRRMLSNEGDFFVNCCYRLSPLNNAYQFFKPKSELIDKVTHLSKNFTSNTVGLHIRKSDHIIAKSISTTEKFVSAIESMIESKSDINFFLSTDDELTKQELMREFGDKILTQKLSGYSRNESSAIQDALVDLYCLSKTSQILGSHHSSFSQTAADIGGIKEFTVK